VGALDHVRVLEMADGWSGAALCGRLLGELGAEVIKVEGRAGDPLRRRPPLVGGTGGLFHMMAAGKASVRIDERDPDGPATLRTLARTADVVLDGHPAGTLESRGLDVAELQRDRPQLIYCSVSTFGRTGPSASWAGADLLGQATSGLMASTGFEGDPPTAAGAPIADHVSGLMAATSVIAALVHRLTTRRGQSVDIAARDCLIPFHSSYLPRVFLEGEAPPRQGFRHPLIAPWDVFLARDGAVVVCAGTDRHWDAILRLVDREDLIGDPLYATAEQRVSRVAEVNGVVQGWISGRPMAEVIDTFESIGVPAGPILEISEVLEQPHFKARDLLVEVPDSSHGTVTTAGSILKMSRTPGTVSRGAPGLGMDNDRILGPLDDLLGSPA
jgi:crotonobetainyl-CoA:carnitine CoA-transferase CaiB-like acyl-CoA transferase